MFNWDLNTSLNPNNALLKQPSWKTNIIMMDYNKKYINIIAKNVGLNQIKKYNKFPPQANAPGF